VSRGIGIGACFGGIVDTAMGATNRGRSPGRTSCCRVLDRMMSKDEMVKASSKDRPVLSQQRLLLWHASQAWLGV